MALALLITLQLVSVCTQAQTDDQAAALMAIKRAVGSTNPSLSSWNSSSSSPCNWTGVGCDIHLKVIKLNMSGFGLEGTLLPNAFSNLTSLQSLDFSKNNLKSPLPAFDPLTDLQYLNLTSNDIQESFPSSLLNLANLVDLHIDNNYFIGSLPEQISKLQNLEQLWMGNSSISGPLPKGLESLTHLTVLSAWGLDLYTMTLPPEWGIWVNLTYLNLHNGQVSGPLPPEWGGNFTKLERLLLYKNDLKGVIPDSWKGMTSLQLVKISNNELYGSVPAWIGQLEHNATVDFDCNYLNGTAPTSFNATTWKGNCFDSDLLAHSQQCTGGLGCSEFFNELNSSSKGRSFPKGAIIGIVVGVVLVLCGILGLVWWLKPVYGSKTSRRRRKGDQDDGDWEVPQGVRQFTFKEITRATKSFNKSCQIGEGGFGKVYVAQLEDNRLVAIKRAADLSFQGTKEFRNEITLLSRLHHRHLVRLEGFCDEKNEQILVYEYMKNGNLHRHLFDKNASTLNWYRRLEIAVSVAQGLDYLHAFANPSVIHRDVKPSNVLLDENMIAKVSDFGISKANPEMDTHVSTRPAGTAGYLDPEYFLRRHLTTASDVYGYGVVLLELLTGQLAIDHKRLEDYNLVGWVKPKLQRKDIQGIIDPRIGPKYPVEAYRQVAELAVQCTSFERADRPSMQTVASTLEGILSKLTPPPEHLLPVTLAFSPGMTGKEPQSQGSTSTEVVSEVKIEFGFQDSVVEPR